jgi:hypothetical protein
MTKIDEAKLRSMTSEERHRLWINARKIDSDEARSIAQMVEQIGLPYSDDQNLRHSDPVFLKMVDIIYSTEGKAAGLAASNLGLPAMAHIDPLLFAALGVDYGAHNEATVNAGAIVASMMTTLGFGRSGKKGKLPATCIAKTAEIYVPSKKR